MGQFTEIMALICIFITMAMLLVQNIIEDRQEKKEAELKKAQETEKLSEINMIFDKTKNKRESL